jgi:hypothetical protein
MRITVRSVFAITLAAAFLVPIANVLAGDTSICSSTNVSPKVGQADSVPTGVLKGMKETILVQSLHRCSGTDPNGRNGSFAFLGAYLPGYSRSRVVFGYGICVDSSVSGCSQGHRLWAQYGRDASAPGCSSDYDSGYVDLGALPATDNHVLSIQKRTSDGAWEMRWDGTYKFAVSTTFACWDASSSTRAEFFDTAWDPGDAVGGSSANPLVQWTAYVTNSTSGGWTSATFSTSACTWPTSNPYNCFPLASDAWESETIR